AIGRGSVWVDEPVKAGEASDPFLLAGFAKRAVLVQHDGSTATTFTLEIDALGDGRWKTWREVALKADEASRWVEIPAAVAGAWIRAKCDRDVAKASVTFQYAAEDKRGVERDGLFKGLSKAGDATSQGAFLLTRGANLRTLSVLAATLTTDQTSVGEAYELSADLKLTKMADQKAADFVRKNTAIPQGIVTADAASVIFEESGVRWRLPRSASPAPAGLLARGALRKAREVCTERDMLQAHGTFYELPALNAKGAIRMRPIATSDAAVHDYCSYRGLLVLSGVSPDAAKDDRHVIRSDDGKAAVWVGAADDLWKLGKPRGHGGPWANTAVRKGAPSDPYLMTGYDKKSLTLTNHGREPVRVTVQLDAAGDGRFSDYRDFTVTPGSPVEHAIPGWINAYWVRMVSAQDAVLSAQLSYE
ncbi:MAG: hypothetical protein ACO3J6_07770, partial [Opitutales bacterium]